MRDDHVISHYKKTIKFISKFSEKPTPWMQKTCSYIYKEYGEIKLYNYVFAINNDDDNKFEIAVHYHNLAEYHKNAFLNKRINLFQTKVAIDRCLENLSQIHTNNSKINDLINKSKAIKQETCSIFENAQNALKQLNTNDPDKKMKHMQLLITLGETENFKNENIFSPEFSSLRLTIFEIYVTNTISEIEDILSRNELKSNHYAKYVFYQFLATAYKVTNLSDISNKYIQMLKQELFIILNDYEQVEGNYMRKVQIKTIIKQYLEEKHYKLNRINGLIEAKYNVELNNCDQEYIEKKYIQYCIENFLNESENIIRNFVDENNTEQHYKELFTTISTIRSLEEVPSNFTGIYYKLLLQHKKSIKQNEAKNCFKKFIEVCVDVLRSNASSLKNEMDFFKYLILYLRSIENCREIIEKIKLKNFCEERLPLKIFLLNILKLEDINNEHLTNLKRATEKLLPTLAFTLLHNLIEELFSFCTLSQPQVINNTIEVEGKLIILSEIIKQVEMLIKEKIYEFRIKNADIVYIDCDLTSEVWKEINIMIIAKTISVQGTRTIDVSGRSAPQFNCKAADGLLPGKDGKNGKPGKNGSSGGNIKFSCFQLRNASDLTIISNGGDGANGQDGGNGAKGEDGYGINSSEFENLIYNPYPNHSLFKNYSLSDRVPKIAKPITVYNVAWDRSNFRLNCFQSGHTYLEGILPRNCQLTYSFYSHWFPCKKEIYILYKGTDAKLGGREGLGGFPGIGGFPGFVDITSDDNQNDYKLIHNMGNNGKKGNNGKPGLPGINGWDMAYTLRDGFFFPIKEIFGKNHNMKINFAMWTRRYEDSYIYCPYRKDYVEVVQKNKYSGILNRDIHNQKPQIQESSIEPTRNKAINPNVVSHLEEIMKQDIIDELNDISKRLDEIIEYALEETEENEEEIINVQMKRQSTFQENMQQYTSIYNKNWQNTLTCKSNNIDLLKFNKSEISLDNLNALHATLFQEKQSINRNDFVGLHNRLLSKYKLKFLENIRKSDFFLQSPKTVMPKSIENYLIRLDFKNEQFVHDILGLLSDYINNFNKTNANNLIKYAHEVDIATILYPIKFFLIEVMSETNSECNVNIYKKIYDEIEILEGKLEKIIKCYTFLCEIINNNSSMLRFLKKQKEKLIETIKSKLNIEAIKTDFCNFIEKSSFNSTAIRELLAVAYECNIKIYILNESNEICLLHDQNPTASNTLYLLYVNKNYVPFKLNKNYIELYSKRVQMSHYLNNIFNHIDTFICKNQFFDNSFTINYSESTECVNFYPSFSDEHIISNIAKYFENCQQFIVRNKLSALSSKHLGSNEILQALLYRFNIYENCITFNEILYILNVIISEADIENSNLSHFKWILLSKCQEKWINEFFLFKLENLYKISLQNTNVAKYVDQTKNKNLLILITNRLNQCSDLVGLKNIEDCLEIDNSMEIDLNTIMNLPLSKWKYLLRIQYLENYITLRVEWSNIKDLQRALHYLRSLESIVGEDLVNQFLHIIDLRKKDLNETKCLNILQFLNEHEYMLNNNFLENLNSTNLSSIDSELLKFPDATNNDERTLQEILQIISINSHTSPGVHNFLKNVNTNKFLNIDEFENKTEEDVQEWSKRFKNLLENSSKETRHNLIAEKFNEILEYILHAIKLCKGFLLRKTQRLAILLMLKHEHNLLSEIATGEGKSFIIIAVSIFHALCGTRSNVITSSSVLAIRDATIHRQIYALFEIDVGHICTDLLEGRKFVYLDALVIFGDLSSFQRDYLLDRFYGKNILGDRDFQILIVDEVDNMLLDHGNNSLYLSHEIAYLDKLESVYLFIWKHICLAKENESFEKQVHAALLFDLFGTLTVQHLASNLKISNSEASVIFDWLLKKKIVDDKNVCLREMNDNDLESSKKQRWNEYAKRVQFIIKKIIHRQREIEIPNCLYDFVLNHLEKWIKNAVIASMMQEGKEYVVDIDRKKNTADIHQVIIIMDAGTGTDQNNSEWEEALHQFLQLKHGCKLSAQSLKAVFISNVSYFKKYNKILGLTGTLGSEVEQNLLERLYNVDFFHMPTAKPKSLIEHESILCASQTEWVRNIIEKTLNIIKKKRSVLIICESIKDVTLINNKLSEEGITDILVYKRDYENFILTEDNEQLGCGRIIIATNLAGRGTDIKISAELNTNGGLHVILTYLSSNIRIEHQAFGRASRNGCHGSAQLIIIGFGNIYKMKMIRDTQELENLSEIEKFYNTKIKQEEHYFDKFTEVYNNKIKSIRRQNPIVNVALERILDNWALWIDMNSSKLSKESTEKSLKTFLEVQNKDFLQFDKWTGNPASQIKVGAIFIEKKKYKKAINLFDIVKKNEPKFCEMACYYKAFCLGKQVNFESKSFTKKKNYNEFLKELKCAKNLFEIRKDICISGSAYVKNLKQMLTKSLLIIDAFEKQQETLINLNEYFIDSIDSILGKGVNSKSFSCPHINEEEIMKKFLKAGVLSKAKVLPAKEKDIEELCENYGISFNELSEFLQDYRDKEIDETVFLNDLKNRISIPSVEDFWSVLVAEGKIINETEFVIVNMTKVDNVNEFQRIKEFEVDIETNDAKHILMKRFIAFEGNDYRFFEKKNLIQAIGEQRFNSFQLDDLFSINKYGEFCVEKLKEYIHKFDIMDIRKKLLDDIPEEDFYNCIIQQLIHEGFLRKHDACDFEFYLNDKYDETVFLQFAPYTESLKSIFRIYFAYRITLENLQEELRTSKSVVFVNLSSEPHTNFMWDLISKEIIQPIRVKDHKSKDIEGILKTYNTDDKSVQETTIRHITSILNHLTGTLKTLDTFDLDLTNIIQLLKEIRVSPLQELRTLTVNGQNHIIKSVKKKYTLKMILSTSFVTILGLCEIAAGLLIQLFSGGLLYFAGEFLISEGISDIFYAATCWRKGYFNWNDYGKYKLVSVLLSITLSGISAAINKGIAMSRFGGKLAMKGVVNKSGVQIAELTGRNLIEEVGIKRVVVQFGKEFAKEAGESILTAMASEGISHIVHYYLRNLCEGISNSILKNMDDLCNNPEIAINLRHLYVALGSSKAKECINFSIKKWLSETEISSSITPYLLNIKQQIANICEKAMKQNQSVSGLLYAKYLSKACLFTKFLTHLNEIQASTSKLLLNITNDINEAIGQENIVRNRNYTENELETFKNDTINCLKTLLKENATQIFSTQILTPILHLATYKAMTYMKTTCQKQYKFLKNKSDRVTYEQKRTELLVRLEDDSLPNEIKQSLINDYNDAIVKLRSKVRDPNLYADLILENGHMDAICLKSCANVLPIIIKEDVKLVVNVENNLCVEHTTEGSENPRIININLANNHYTGSNGNNEIANSISSNDYNCLYQSLVCEVPELSGLDAENFRKMISENIRCDEEIGNIISSGRHAFTIDRNIYGGYTAKQNIDKFYKHLMNSNTTEFNQFYSKSRTSEQFNIHLSELINSMRKNNYPGGTINYFEVNMGSILFVDSINFGTTSAVNNEHKLFKKEEKLFLIRTFNYDSNELSKKIKTIFSSKIVTETEQQSKKRQRSKSISINNHYVDDSYKKHKGKIIVLENENLQICSIQTFENYNEIPSKNETKPRKRSKSLSSFSRLHKY